MQLQQFEKLKIKARDKNLESASQRITSLRKISQWISDHQIEIQQSLFCDFQKPYFETQQSEIKIVLDEIKHTIKNLEFWMRPQQVETPFVLIGHQSEIHYQAKGVVLIISPWNYPFQLALAPLIAAIAAGNTVVIKPSELTTNTSELIESLVNDLFTSDEVIVVQGGKEITEQLLQFDFDHVFFTGSTAVGRIIATHCAKKLIPCTLELGGKSPVIIDNTADITDAARKVHWGKYLNRGQTCVAPDYLLIHESVKAKFIDEYNKIEKQSLNDEPCQFVSEKYKERIYQFLNPDQQLLFSHERKNTFITEIKDNNHPLMKEEIFGPILPYLTFKNVSEIPEIIRQNQNPLALYLFSKSEKNIQFILQNTQSGGVGINAIMVHLANPNLPFGGVKSSGLGQYHGHAGFLEFSLKKSVIRQHFGFSAMKLVMPPYTRLKSRLLKKL